jgi:hypothetical protein
MMKGFPKLNEVTFVRTREQFHTVAKIIGKVRETLVTPLAKNDNLWLNVVDKGFAMPEIENMKNIEIGCNIESMKIEISVSGKYDSIDFNGKSLAEIANNLMINLNLLGIEKSIDFSPFISSDKIDVSDNDSSDFLTQLYNFHRLLKEFHSRIREGVKTQVCLWPHHFDNAFIWYSGKKVNEQDEQMGIGVSNGDEMYPLPYIYMTFGPPLRTTNKLEIIDGAILHDSDWTGLILPYEAIENKTGIESQKRLIEDFFNTSFSSVIIGFLKR